VGRRVRALGGRGRARVARHPVDTKGAGLALVVTRKERMLIARSPLVCTRAHCHLTGRAAGGVQAGCCGGRGPSPSHPLHTQHTLSTHGPCSAVWQEGPQGAGGALWGCGPSPSHPLHTQHTLSTHCPLQCCLAGRAAGCRRGAVGVWALTFSHCTHSTP